MICKALANELITRFGYRRPDDAENRDFKQSLDRWRNGGATCGTRAANLGISAGIIEKRLPGIISSFFELRQKIFWGEFSREQKVAVAMNNLKETVSGRFDEVINGCSGPVVEFLKTVGTGLRTAFMIIGLNYKMIARKLDSVPKITTDISSKFSAQGLEVIKEIASVPQQSILHSLINFLCKRSLTEDMKSTDMIIKRSFDESRFEFADDGYGVTYSAIDDYQRLHREECARNEGFRKIFEDSLKHPIFGCPAKRVSLSLLIDGQEQSLNYVEAVYRLSEKQVSPILL